MRGDGRLGLIILAAGIAPALIKKSKPMARYVGDQLIRAGEYLKHGSEENAPEPPPKVKPKAEPKAATSASSAAPKAPAGGPAKAKPRATAKKPSPKQTKTEKPS